MRALVVNDYGPPEAMTIQEMDDPVAADDEVLIDVAAAGINFADVLSIAGKYQVKTPTPFVSGNEAAGVITAVGKDVKRFSVGDKVLVATRGGAFAEKAVANEKSTTLLPDGLNYEQGAGFSVTYGTSYHALKQSANLQPGETVLVLGAAGGVGITAVEIAKAMGARV
ncbi:MAG: alcohol dehydrogenase catalytic domain-containing protein, partial [Woeseiaceae bacterium]